MDDGADAGDQQQQQHRELIDVEAQVDDEVAGFKQPVKRDRLRSVPQNLNKGRDRQTERENNAAESPLCGLLHPTAARQSARMTAANKGRRGMRMKTGMLYSCSGESIH